MHADAGQAAPMVLVAVVAVTALALVMAQGGRLGLLDATADTGADAAVLAAADTIAEELEGPAGFTWMVTREVPPDTLARATDAAATIAASNDTTLLDLATETDGRTYVTVRVATGSQERLGQPALDDEQAAFRGESIAAARTDVVTSGPGSRGCLGQAAVDDIAQRAGIDPLGHRPSGLTACGGADVRNLAPVLHEAVLLVEQATPARIEFSSGFRTYEEQADLFDDPTNPYPVAEPGTSWHHTGLAFDASNWQMVRDALATMADPPLCQPYPITDPVHFSHADYAECGGALPRPPDTGGLRVTAEPARLVDAAS